MSKSKEKTVRFYRQLPYTRQLEPKTDSDGRFYFVARIKEIPQLRVHGSTREEALLNLDQIFDEVIEELLDEGIEVPEPVRWPQNTGGVAWGTEPRKPTVRISTDSHTPRWRGDEDLNAEETASTSNTVVSAV